MRARRVSASGCAETAAVKVRLKSVARRMSMMIADRAYNQSMPAGIEQIVFHALDRFCIELPSWGFATTGTRFGKFQQAAAATSTEEKFSDAGQVHRFTGCCPTVAVHVLWDFPRGKASAADVAEIAARHGVRVGSINPNTFQDQIYKHGSLGNPDAEVRRAALRHILDCVEIASA